jgi:hypothetical protein
MITIFVDKLISEISVIKDQKREIGFGEVQ